MLREWCKILPEILFQPWIPLFVFAITPLWYHRCLNFVGCSAVAYEILRINNIVGYTFDSSVFTSLFNFLLESHHQYFKTFNQLNIFWFIDAIVFSTWCNINYTDHSKSPRNCNRCNANCFFSNFRGVDGDSQLQDGLDGTAWVLFPLQGNYVVWWRATWAN